MVLSTRLVAAALFAGSAFAANPKAGYLQPCDLANNHLDQEQWTFITDCDPTTYCASNSTCLKRGCRRDIYPYGFNGVPYDQLPPVCPENQFCPDEGSACRDKGDVGAACQKDRDEQCKPPPNAKELAYYLNVNGSICLNFQCYTADVNTGQACVIDNTPYTTTTDAGAEYGYVISRDNCRKNLYCDGGDKVCKPKKHRHEACVSHKECISYNCLENKQCGKAADEPLKPQPWVYVVISLAIVIALVGVMVGLWLLHRRAREENQVKLQEYYNEQIAYRQSIMSMSHAKNSLLSLPPNTTPGAARASLYDDSTGYSSGLLPPNIQREASTAWSDDSEVLLMDSNRPSQSRFRG